MRFEFKEFVLDSEGNEFFTLYKRGVYKETVKGKSPKVDKIGKEKLSIVGYFRTIDFAMTRMGNLIVAENSEYTTVMDKLDSLEREIIEVSKKLNLRVKIVE